MAQSPHHLSDETSDRLYTPEELDAFAAAEAEKSHDWSRPAPQPGPPTAATYRPDPLTDPLPTTVERLRTMHYAYPTFHRTIEAALKRLR